MKLGGDGGGGTILLARGHGAGPLCSGTGGLGTERIQIKDCDCKLFDCKDIVSPSGIGIASFLLQGYCKQVWDCDC